MSRINWVESLKWNEDQVEDLRLVGFAYIRQGKYDIALSLFEALCVLAPESAYDAQTLGAIHLQMGHPKQALKWLQYALTLDTDHAPTLLNLAKAFLMLGRKEEGIKLAKILRNELDPMISNMAKALVLAFE